MRSQRSDLDCCCCTRNAGKSRTVRRGSEGVQAGGARRSKMYSHVRSCYDTAKLYMQRGHDLNTRNEASLFGASKDWTYSNLMLSIAAPAYSMRSWRKGQAQDQNACSFHTLICLSQGLLGYMIYATFLIISNEREPVYLSAGMLTHSYSSH